MRYLVRGGGLGQDDDYWVEEIHSNSLYAGPHLSESSAILEVEERRRRDVVRAELELHLVNLKVARLRDRLDAPVRVEKRRT